MRGLTKRLSGAIVALVLVAACGEVIETGGFVPARLVTAESESPDLRVILAHEFAADEANAGTAANADGYDTTRKAIAHELESDGPPRRSSPNVTVTDLPVR
ncbi:MAG TPA: hypothetical protein VLA91_13015 [Acidimicrobiia bacterium]|nr:hypothetical protein [Acidimicrobiia bacterium]